MAVYRVNSNFNGLRAGQLVEIDPNDPAWKEAVDRKRLVPRPQYDHLVPPSEAEGEFKWGFQ